MTETIILHKGAHDAAECADGKRCLFEWYNHLTRHQETATCPPGVSPVLHLFGMRLNDTLPDDKRQELVFALPNGDDPLAGTAGDGLDEARSYLALDWLIRTFTPAWLDLAGLGEEATALRELRRVADTAAAQSAGPVARQASEKAAAARDAAWAAAGAAAWAAARAAARDAVWAAAWDAAWAAAGAAAWAAARDAAWAAARAAARDAAWAAARAKLAPTVAELQDSAIALYHAMITPGGTS